MSIENSLERIATALEVIAGNRTNQSIDPMALAAAPTPSAATVPPPPATVPPPPPAPAAEQPAMNMQQLNEILVKEAERIGDSDGTQIFGVLKERFQCNSISELPVESYPMVVDALATIPSAA